MIHNSQNGISLLFTVLITSLVLAVALGITSLLIQGMRMMGEIGYSVTAFYAADSGIEEALYDLYISSTPTPTHSGNLDSAHYETLAKCCNPGLANCSLEAPDDCLLGPGYVGLDCNALNYCLKSAGSYKEVKRAIEIQY